MRASITNKSRLLLALLMFLSLVGSTSQAATALEMNTMRAKALAWLYLHQDGDGFWDGPGNTDIQATSATLMALDAAGINSGYSRSAALSWLANAHARSVDALGFKASALGQAGFDVTQLLAQLQSDRDGRYKAWGSYSGFQPSMPDTAVAIDAFILSDQNYADAGSTLGWALNVAQNVDGGWAYISPSIGNTIVRGPSRLIPTARATLSTSRWATNFGVNGFITPAINWLKAKQQADGGFNDDPNTSTGSAYETALVLQAIRQAQAVGNTAANGTTATVTAAEDFLVAAQDSNGSWNNDPMIASTVISGLPATILLDQDSDGIPDVVEAFTGTNPIIADARTLLQPIGDGEVGTHSAELIASTEFGEAINTFLSASTGALSFFINAGVLPEGLTLDENTGQITGTSTSAGTFNIEYSAAFADGRQEIRVAAITVASPKAVQIPMAPAYMLVLMALFLMMINGFMRRSSRVLTITLMLAGFMLPPDSLLAAETIPPAISERIINEYSGGRKAFQDAGIKALQADIAQSLKSAKSAKAKRMFGRSLVPKLTQYQALAEQRLQAMENRLRKLGNTQAAEKVSRRQQALVAKINALQNNLEALDGNRPVKGDTAIAQMQTQVAQTRAMQHPDHPVPTWRQDEPGPALELSTSEEIPAYLSSNYHNQASQMFAFNGNILLLAAAPQTPTEAASCNYTAADLADDGKDVTLTTAIHDLAKSLDYSTTKIFEYVANEIAFEPYYGALKGANNTLETKAGSATDQSSLLIALLRASNIPARYVRADVLFQDSSIAETESVVNRWLQTKSYVASANRLFSGQNPTASFIGENPSFGLRFAHVWVEACVPYAHYRGASLDNAGHRWIPLDPSFETRRYETGISSAENFDFDAYLSGFNSKLPHEAFEQQVRQTLTGSNSLKEVGYQSDKIDFKLDILPASLPYHIDTFTNWSNSSTPETSALPDSHRYFLHVNVKNSANQALGATTRQRLSAILLQPLTLSFEGASPADQTILDDWRLNGGLLPTGINLSPVLHIEGVTVATGTGSVLSETRKNKLTLSVSLAEARSTLFNACSTESNTKMVNAVCFDGIAAANYHALQAYGFQASRSVMEGLADQVVENVNAVAQLSDDLDGTLGRFLHYAALKYMGDISTASQRIGQLKGNTGDSGLHLGLTSTQSHVEKFLDLPFGINKHGFLIDVPGGQSRSRNLITGGIDFESFVLSGYAASAQESFIWRETARLDAVSTIIGLQHASAVGSTVLTINTANQATELPKIKTVSNDPGNLLAYPDNFVSNILQAQYLNNGFEIKVPDEQINFKGWEGYVLVATKTDNNGSSASFPISGGFAGGFSVPDPTPITTYNPITNTGYQGGSTSTASSDSSGSGGSSTDSSAIAQVNHGTVGNGGGSSNPNNTFAGDPVNLVTGNFYHTERDLIIPNRDLPFVFERAYNSRAAVEGPLGYGWTHSFNHQLRFLDDKADGVSSGVDSDNQTSSLIWLDGSGGEKRVGVSGSAAGVAIGSAMSAPAGSRFSLTREADGRYLLVENNGLRYQFVSVAGQVGDVARLEKIISRNGNQLLMHYNGNKLSSVSDDNNRSIIFSYTGNHITGLTDWTGRSHQYNYDTDGNLIEYHNPKALAGQQAPTQYRYYHASDSANIDHAIKQITLPKGNSLLFEYYADGRVFRHTNSADEQFSFFYNDFRRETQVTDARGFITHTFFNQDGNPIQVIDATGAVTTYEYNDPQDPYHRTAIVNALKHRTQYQYDAQSNVTQITLPSGNTVAYSHFSVFNQPGKVKDANGHYRLFQYDNQGNLSESIALKSGLGATIDPASYQPDQHPHDILAWTRHRYDSVGNKQSIEQIRDIANAQGFKRNWSYDANQLYATQLQRCGDKDGDGQVNDDPCDSASLSFDSLGRMSDGVNTRFEAIHIDYNALNQIVRATDSVGQLRDYGYDDNGNPDYEGLLISLNGIPTLVDAESADFDDSDRQRLALDAGGYATYFEYDRMGNLTALINPDNYKIRFTHDPLGQVTTAYDQEGRVARRKLDALGRMQSLTDPNGNSQTYHYYDADQDARLKQHCDAENRCTTFSYDNNGNVIQITDNAGNSTLTDYDALNRPIRVVSPQYTDPTFGLVRPVSHYRYDRLGNLIEVRAGHTDSTGILSAADQVLTQQSNTYDDWGRQLSQSDPLNQSSHYQYNPHSDLIRIEDPKGQIVERDYQYGGLIQTQRSYQHASDTNPHIIHYSRNALGQTETQSAPEISYRYHYDQAHRLKQVIDSRGISLSYDWSPGGLLDTMSDKQGNDTDYQYDPTGRLTHIFAPNGETIGYHYDDGGRLIQQDLPGNIRSQYRYNKDNSLKSQSTENSTSNTLYHSQDITYDSLGRKQTENSVLNGHTKNKTYSYDKLSRLLTETQTGSAGNSTASWGYDRFNNRITETQQGITQHYHHNAAQQLTHITQNTANGTKSDQFQYDENGNLIKHCQNNISSTGNPATDCSGSSELSLNYDVLDRQVQATKTGIPPESYQYDPQGRRIQKISGSQSSQYHYDGDTIYQQAQGNNWTTPTARYVHGAGTDTPQIYYGQSQTQIYHQDANNSVIATTDENGTLTGTQGYDAWGNQQASQTTGQAIPTYGYTGREPDATGLIYYRARYYHPQIGRFTQKDPLGFIDGINRYAYALNSPTNFIDPSGLASQGSNSTPTPQNQGGYWTNVLNNIQLGLDVVGVAGDAVPGIGNLVAAGADLLNAGISAGRGDKLGASLSLAAIIPYAGIAATTGKVVNRVGDVASGARSLADPKNIRFTQDSIGTTFRDGRPVQGLIDGLKSGKVSPNDLPPIRTFQKDGLTFSLDNRRLFAAGQAGVKVRTVPATAQEIARELPGKFTTPNQGCIICIRGRLE